MAWSAPRTWVTGELVTSTIMNQHVRDNLVALRDLTPIARISFANDGAVPADNAMRIYTGTTATVFDNDTMAGTGILTCKTAGKFWVAVEAYSAVVGNVHVYAIKNSATLLGGASINPNNVGDQNRATAKVHLLVDLAASDTIKPGYSHSAGLGIGAAHFFIEMYRIAA